MKKIILLLGLTISSIGSFAQIVKNDPIRTQKNSNKPLYPANRKIITARRSTNMVITSTNKNNISSRPATKTLGIKHPVRVPDRKLAIQYHTNKKFVKQKKD